MGNLSEGYHLSRTADGKEQWIAVYAEKSFRHVWFMIADEDGTWDSGSGICVVSDDQTKEMLQDEEFSFRDLGNVPDRKLKIHFFKES